ncbi:sigma-70 family RNA polymerase sigma factor [Methylorubrum rhodesianum]|uniref:sigma-70 family RNA polymerase sigma factor n=1 Tax=Methylorubrum rhodesianum TaxID=29427 RepID=UPI003CFBC5FD
MLIVDGLQDRSESLQAAVPALPLTVRGHLGAQLQAAYDTFITIQPPQRLLDLITQLDSALSAHVSENAGAFRQGLIEALPALRAFALSLVASNEARADDLVQETVVKAWAKQESFVPGTNLKAWLCTILRNTFYTEIRRYKREVEDADGALAAGLSAVPAQEHGSDLRVVMAYIAELPATMREALLLVGAQGLTYEDAAELIGCRVGTVKSRVSRARALLASSLGIDTRRAAV